MLDPNGLPISLLREADGGPLKVQVGLPGGRRLVAQVWKVQVGRVPLLLLDSDVEDNELTEREVTDRLYGGGSEHRLLQEMLLGIGGVRALRAYSRLTGAPAPTVFHTNEGHAGFLGVERIRELTEDHALSFDEAVEAARSATLFTTHTPVPAGIDRFAKDLVAQHFGGDNACPGVPVDRVLALGAEDYEGGDPSVFNMAVMGFRLAQRANGVSELHGHVAAGDVRPPVARLRRARGADRLHHQRRARADLGGAGGHRPRGAGDRGQPDRRRGLGRRPARPRGRHLVGPRRCCGPGWWPTPVTGCATSWVQRGASEAELGWVDSVLDPEVLTIGFARRVPSYKRLTLMMRDPERLTALLHRPGAADPDRHRRQGAPGRRRRQEADPGAGPVRRRPGRAAPDRVPAQLRHRDGADALPGLRRLAEQPAAAARGVRHVRHEGRAQRLPQPLGARRLVGRVVRRPQRLGHPDRRRRHRPRPPRRPRGGRALRPAREDRRPAVLRPGRRTGCRPAGSRWCATPCRPSARRCSRPGWCATTCSRSTRRRTAPARALDGGFAGAQ